MSADLFSVLGNLAGPERNVTVGRPPASHLHKSFPVFLLKGQIWKSQVTSRQSSPCLEGPCLGREPYCHRFIDERELRLREIETCIHIVNSRARGCNPCHLTPGTLFPTTHFLLVPAMCSEETPCNFPDRSFPLKHSCTCLPSRPKC